MVPLFSWGSTMFAVAGAAGRTGAATATALIKRGQKVRVLVRGAEQGAPWSQHKHSEVAVLDLNDAAALGAALEGLTGVSLLLPPPPKEATDYLEAQNSLLTSLVTAVKRSGVKRVAFLSSIGAQHPAGTGPIVSLNRAEKALKGIAPSVTFVRAASFLENWAPLFLDALEHGTLPSFGNPHIRFPQVGAADVGAAAALALEENVPGTRVIEVAGKENWSAEDIAVVLTSLLGTPIKAVEHPVDSEQAALERAGLSASFAALFAERSQALARGLLQFTHPHQVLRGSTSLFDALKALV